jgi:hypothetical protein
MAGKQTDDIVVGANGSILVAPVATALPANIGAAFPAGWVDLGYADENGAKITDAKTIADIPVWQLFYPARKIVATRDLTFDFALRQFDAETVKLGFGGGSVTDDGGGMFTYEPPDPSVIDERAMAVEWQDNDKHYRFIVLRGLVTSNTAVDVARTKSSDLPITFGIIGEDGVVPWKLQTDDASFADIVGS